MRISIPDQIKFFNWQLKELHDEFQTYLYSPMNQHFAGKEAFIGKVYGVDRARGNLLVRFDSYAGPRLNTPLEGFLFGGVDQPDKKESWSMSYEQFRQVNVRLNSSLLPIFYLKKSKDEGSIIGCKDVDSEFFEAIENLIERGTHPRIVFARKDPPYQYLINLKTFVERNKADEVLNMSLINSLEEWTPQIAPDSSKLLNEIVHKLENEPEVIIQGPPGTGKSTLISKIVKRLVSESKSVCISALTNKALMEVAEKNDLKDLAEEGRVFKTNLTLNEHRDNRFLKKADGLTIGKGNLLLATYYKLSDWFNPQNNSSGIEIKSVYDVVIIEEASQCFLTTIAAFRRLGVKVLIVGDPLQLPPIVLNEGIANKINPNMLKYARGLSSYVANVNSSAYMLNETYRLSRKAAELTSIFYKHPLVSKQTKDRDYKLGEQFKDNLDNEATVKIHYLDLLREGNSSKDAIMYCTNLVENLLNQNPKMSIALLAPFRKTVLTLQESVFGRLGDDKEIVIETIDRIQGLTVDCCIFLLTLDNPSFALNVNRFNVATSRAKYGTLIITDKEFVRFKGIDKRVTEYLYSLSFVQ